jgi:hypothetical protein
MSLIRISESDDWIVDYDRERGQNRVSYFEDNHFKDEYWFDEYKEDATVNLEPLVFPDDIEKPMKEAERVIMSSLYLL